MQENGRHVSRSPIWPLLIVGLGTLVVPLDSAVNIDFPAIVAHFGLPIPMIQWIVISYVLTQTSLMLTFGRIGDMLGYRRVFLCGTAVSTLAFVGCALSPTYGALLAARVAQGIGAGLILSCGPALATSLFPEAMRTQVLAQYMMMFGIGVCAWAVGIRIVGGTVRLERGVQLPGADRGGGVYAGMDAAAAAARASASRSMPPGAHFWQWPRASCCWR